MCRNIKTLHNFQPPATETEVRASAIQFVRKLSGFTKPSKTNEAAFNRAVERVTDAAQELLGSLVTNAPPNVLLLPPRVPVTEAKIQFDRIAELTGNRHDSHVARTLFVAG
jgi:hypothetical protein